MLPDRVSNPGPPTYESGALPIALRGPASCSRALAPACDALVNIDSLLHVHQLLREQISFLKSRPKFGRTSSSKEAGRKSQ